MNRNDPKWTDYFISLMSDDEKVNRNGKDYPRITGLRRITLIEVGLIPEGTSPPPVAISGGVATTFTIECHLHEKLVKSEGLRHSVERWSGTADCTTENDGGNVYRGAFADTRAEARAYVRLLRLSRCSAEEFDDKLSKKSEKIDSAPVPSSADIKQHQTLFQRLSINGSKFYEVCGKKLFGKKFDSSSMTREQAMELAEVLNLFQQGKEPIPEPIKDAPF